MKHSLRPLVFAFGTFMCVLAVALSTPLALAQNYSRYHFDDPVPLELNPDRIAVFAGAQDPIAVEWLAEHGITVTSVEPSPIPGWQLLDIEMEAVDGLALEDALNRVARQGPFDFVSPVFFDDLSGPLIPTRDILVQFNPGIGGARQVRVLAEANVGTVLDRDWANMPGAYRIRSHSNNGFVVLEQANALAQRPEVKFAEPDMIFTDRDDLIPNDPFFNLTWGVHNKGQASGCTGTMGTPDIDMDGPEAWDITTGASSLIVVILDEGVQQNHPDINQIPGADFTGQGTGGGPGNECDNHGTPVAGCVSGIINNSLGGVGIAPNCVIASARTSISNVPCDGSGTSQASNYINALAWAETIGARVTNTSRSLGYTSSALEQKYEDTRNAGIVHFGSAGNNSNTDLSYPASLSTVNAVAAVDQFGNLAGFSNYGSGLAFSAPGVDIVTTDRTGSDGYVNGDYVCINGTSFASPYAAGVAALVLSVDSSLDAFDVEQIMQQSAMDLGAPGYDTTFGWGLVNAHQAILEVPPSCPWDLDGNGTVGAADLLALLVSWGPCEGCPADFDGDGSVGASDLLALLVNWGPCP